LCGIAEQGLTHHVHHKKPFREFGSPEEANKLSNLITLCPTCHRKVEQAVRMRSGLSGLSYILGNLSPLFLMCDARDIGIHFEPRAEIVNGDPAVVIFERIPVGVGFSERLFEVHNELIAGARELVESCDCFDGCPSCTGPAGENGVGGKKATMAIIEVLSLEHSAYTK
jgi:DEAD/DEAH box helicase domain-containing protein